MPLFNITACPSGACWSAVARAAGHAVKLNEFRNTSQREDFPSPRDTGCLDGNLCHQSWGPVVARSEKTDIFIRVDYLLKHKVQRTGAGRISIGRNRC